MASFRKNSSDYEIKAKLNYTKSIFQNYMGYTFAELQNIPVSYPSGVSCSSYEAASLLFSTNAILSYNSHSKEVFLTQKKEC